MQADITREFETTEFAAITTGIINPYLSRFTILGMTIKPGAGAPAHISATEDKLFILIGGQLKYLIGDRTAVAGPGARVQVTRGTVRGFTNVGDADACHILVSTPRRHEEFFRDLHDIPDPREEHMDLLPGIAAPRAQAHAGDARG